MSIVRQTDRWTQTNTNKDSQRMEKQVDSETHTRSHAFAYIYTLKKKFYRQFECSKNKSNCEKNLTVLLLFSTLVSVAFKMLD